MGSRLQPGASTNDFAPQSTSAGETPPLMLTGKGVGKNGASDIEQQSTTAAAPNGKGRPNITRQATNSEGSDLQSMFDTDWQVVDAGKGAGKASPAVNVPRAGKAQGKGPPPVPPQAKATPLKGKAKGKGKGKGKMPPPAPPAPPARWAPPAPPPKANGKGASKGAVYDNDHRRPPPPPHLVAPGPQRVRVTPSQRKCEGTYWQRLSPWDPKTAEVLQCTCVDTEELLRQWQIAAAPLAVAPTHVWVPPGAITSRPLFQDYQLLIKSVRLTPEIVRRGLSEDIEALTPDQARILDIISRGMYDEIIGLIHGFVQMRGVAALPMEEAILWAMETSPGGRNMARYAYHYFTLQRDVAGVAETIDTVIGLLQELEFSRVLSTTLQTVLIILNTLSQEEHKAFNVSELPFLADGKLNQHAWPLVKVVAENLQATHERRGRLRFLRMLAVGHAPIGDSAKRIIWSCLDDLKESPWDVVPLLQRCHQFRAVDEFQDLLMSELQNVQRLQRHLGQFIRNGLGSSQPRLQEQIQTFMVSVDSAELRLSRGKVEFEAAVSQLLATFMGPPPNRLENFTSARSALCGLGNFGVKLDGQLRQIEKRRRTQSGHGPNKDGWPVVDTSHIVEWATKDVDILRSLHAPQLPRDIDQVSGESTSAVECTSAADSGFAKKSEEKLFAHMMHGGQDGEYRRDPETGNWIPVGATAAMLARDRGNRGAVAGFFSTYSSATGHA